MPLSKPENYDARFLPYQVKRAIVENKCKGCDYLIEVVDDQCDDVTVLGCIYPNDIKGINANTREPYLTTVEIAHNTCLFWFGAVESTSSEPDSRPEGITEYV